MVDLKERIPNAAFVFRGYNVTNLGRSPELLTHRAYGAIVERTLHETSRIASDLLSRKIDLVERVRQKQETNLDSYADAVALILAMEQAQLRLLDEFFDIEHSRARMAFGYSLGEIVCWWRGA